MNENTNIQEETKLHVSENENQETVQDTEKTNVETQSDVTGETELKEDLQTSINSNADEEEMTPENEIADLKEQINKLKDESARNRADFYNLQQEYTNYVRRAKADIPAYKNAGIEAVIESLLSVFDDIDAAKKHGDLEEGPFVAISNKLETTLKTTFELERCGNIGDDFDPNMHEALLVAPNPSVSKEEIGEIIQSGWKIGERVIRAAKVVVFSPTE